MASRLITSSRISATARSVTISSLPEKIISVYPKSLSALPSCRKKFTASGFVSSTPLFDSTSASCGVSVPMQVRFSHVDVANVPDFSEHRLRSTRDPHSISSKSDAMRKAITCSVSFAGTVVAATAIKFIARTAIEPIGPSAKTLAEGTAEVNLKSIPEGKNLVMKWRNKPLFIRHRTAEEIERERAVPLSELRDKETDEQRVQDPKWLICLGICTHLGCVPISNAGECPGGFYCPCHASHFDASGRIRKGPAPTNLEVPKYRFIDENTVLIG